MAFGVRPTESARRHRDLDRLIDYREYEGTWSWWFEELPSGDANSSYAEDRFMRRAAILSALLLMSAARMLPINRASWNVRASQKAQLGTGRSKPLCRASNYAASLAHAPATLGDDAAITCSTVEDSNSLTREDSEPCSFPA